MDFTFTFEQKMIQDSARKTFEKYYSIEEIRSFIESPTIRNGFSKAIAESGSIGIMAHEKVGGLGLGAVEALPILIEAGKSIVPFPIQENIIASKILSIHNKYIASSIVSGSKLSTIAWKVDEKGHYDAQKKKLSGIYDLVPFAGFADWMIVPVKLSKANKTQMALICLNLKSENVHLEKVGNMDLTYPMFRVRVDDYSVEGEQIIGNVDDGARLYELMRKLGALFSSAEMLGVAEKSLNVSVNYSKERVQFNQQIGKFQAVKHIAAESYVLLENIRVATEYAAWAIDQQIDDHSISIAKGYTSDAALKIVQNAVQMHGGIGFTWENDIHLYLKRVFRSSFTIGDAYTYRESLASKILS